MKTIAKLNQQDRTEAKHLEQLLAENARLRDALQAAEHELDNWHNWQLNCNAFYPKSVGSDKMLKILVQARSALAQSTPDGKEMNR